MKPDTQNIQLIVADNEELFLDGFKLMVEHDTNYRFKLIATATNGHELLEKVIEFQPDVVITSIGLPEMDGWQATGWLKSKFPATPVIAFSHSAEEKQLLRMIQAGVKGYLLKNSKRSEIIQAIETVYEGGNYFCNCLSCQCIKRLSKICDLGDKQQFSFNEIEIIKLICKEYSSREIADLLHLKLRTIEDYRHKILEKMDVRNIAGLAIYAVKNEIVHLNELLV